MDKKLLITECINEMKRVEESTLQFLEDTTKDGSDQSNLSHFLGELNIKDDKNKLKEFLRILSNISNNHHRFQDFFNKVEQIITFYLEDIKKFFSEFEIFRIFCKNKKILLFLFEAKIIIPNKKMFCFFDNNEHLYGNNNLQYFYIEFKSFIEEELALRKVLNDFIHRSRIKIPIIEPYNYAGEEIAKDLELFKKKRRIGENDNHLCEIIRNDSLNDFIVYLNQYKVSCSYKIEASIYETNPFLLKKESHSIIEYAAFYGSIQIFKYLLKNNAELNPSLWIYAIHGQNYELIHLLEENNVKLDKVYETVIKETIKCHCNDIMNYIIDQYEKEINFSITTKSVKNYNYVSLIDRVDDLLTNIKENIFDLCKYDYIQIFDILVKGKCIDINMTKRIKLKTHEESNDSDDYDYDYDVYINGHGFYEEDDACITKSEISLLYLALENDNSEIIQILLAEPDIDIFYNYLTEEIKKRSRKVVYTCKKTILHAAVEEDNIDMVKSLISNDKIDINIKQISNGINGNGETTALNIAIQNNNSEIVDLLLQHPKIDVQLKLNSIDNEDYDDDDDEYREIKETPNLFLAVKQKNPQIVKLLLSKNEIDVNDKYKKITYEKDENGDFSIEIKRCERTALHEAIENKDVEIVKLLLNKNDIDVNCIAYFKDEMIYYDNYEDLDEVEYSKTPLFMAVMAECPVIVELLLSNDKIEPNTLSFIKLIKKDEEEEEIKIAILNFTALHYAVFIEDIDIITILMANKSININTENEYGQKPIDITENEKITELFTNRNH